MASLAGWHAHSTRRATAVGRKFATKKHEFIETLTLNVDRPCQDLDIFCLSSYPGGAEAIKRHLCEANNQFYAVPAQDPKDEWNVLWWRTDSNDPDFQRFKYQES